MIPHSAIAIVALVSLFSVTCHAADVVITERMHHLRQQGTQEWAEFPKQQEAQKLELTFTAQVNATDRCLQLRQQDIKQPWRLLLNGKQLGQLHRDENDMVVYFEVPTGALKDGENRIVVHTTSTRGGDDIRVGEIHLLDRTKNEVLGESKLIVEVSEDFPNSKKAEAARIRTPARITIINQDGALQETGATSNGTLAVRPGTIYTGNGRAEVPLPAGEYTIYAGRGFEYSLASAKVRVDGSNPIRKELVIRREVPTHGWVACDTHVHTRTHSGHGNSTVQERMLSLAGEGIELPIATDHNVHIDHNPFAKEMGVREYFTPVIGNEVTTKLAHFNVFPVAPGTPVPDHRGSDWKTIFDEIDRVPGLKVVILNHARDLHSNVRPFGPLLFNEEVGADLQQRQLRANAMEVVNSSANQTDIMRLFQDWMSTLNRGLLLTPVGSSDSHDVARHFVGQGRTYIRCDDRDPGNIDIDMATNNFVQGRVMVSFGLMTELTVDGSFGPGELARVSADTIKVQSRVLGPSWVKATKVTLFMNGQPVKESPIKADDAAGTGVKWQGSWELPRPKHDVHLVTIATGPGISDFYWRTAKPYQPTSPEWDPTWIGCSGAVWLDIDGDGRRTAAYDYAARAFAESGGKLPLLLKLLAKYDSTVAAQAAHLFQNSGSTPAQKLDRMLSSAASRDTVKQSAAQVQAGISRYLEAWRKNQIAVASQ